MARTRSRAWMLEMECRTFESWGAGPLKSTFPSYELVKREKTESEICAFNPDSMITVSETVKQEKIDTYSVKQELLNPEPTEAEKAGFKTRKTLEHNGQVEDEPPTYELHTNNDIPEVHSHSQNRRWPRRCKKRQASDLIVPLISAKSSRPVSVPETESEDTNDPSWTPHITTSVSKRKHFKTVKHPLGQPWKSTSVPKRVKSIRATRPSTLQSDFELADTSGVRRSPHTSVKRPRGRPQKSTSLTLTVTKQMLKSKKNLIQDPPKSHLKQITQHDNRKKVVSKTNERMPAACSKNQRNDLCETCGKVFLSKRDLRRHERTHTGAKPFTCSVCQRAFNDEGNMRKHMAVHSGKQPYVCALCGRGFSWSGNLCRHKFLIHEIRTEACRNKPFWHECPICHCKFKCKKSVKRHVSSSKCSKKRVGSKKANTKRMTSEGWNGTGVKK
ncbi:zinc finger protein mnm-2-like [Xyrauchen texanus]|uniref:zinc finger protein mnm-2-like n=1 Tax=Xyrauchen texanus TaxID=154827 RepID=UPI0022427A29|nr:zinc finger protein mnm-2-like [Xyrauchen texanus]